MKQHIFLIALLVAFALPLAVRANQITVWGFPLGATQSEMRAAVGDPSNKRDSTRTSPLLPGLPSPPKTEAWQYSRGGSTFYVNFSNGIATTISISQMSPTLDQTAASLPVDPLGLHLGDTAGTLLLKTHAVDRVLPKSGVEIIAATLFVIRDNLRYNYQITNGLIQGEWISIVQ